MATFATTDICDTYPELMDRGHLRNLLPVFEIYGSSRPFYGPIVTVKAFEDDVLVTELLETKGDGRVLVIDGGGSMRCAIIGRELAQLAQDMGWSGVLLNGYIRDVGDVNGCDIGVRALGCVPRRPSKKRVGEKHVPVHFGGTTIHDGEWLYADNDGILISKTELSIENLEHIRRFF